MAVFCDDGNKPSDSTTSNFLLCKNAKGPVPRTEILSFWYAFPYLSSLISSSDNLVYKQLKSQGKVFPLLARLWEEVQLYSSMTAALKGGQWSAAWPGRTLPPGKTRYPLYRRLGEPQGRSGQVWKNSTPRGLDPRTVQPVASRYTD